MLTLWRPERELACWSRDFDDLLGRFDAGSGISSFSPAVDVEETEGGFVLLADLPGLNEKDIDIRVDGQELVISGTRETSSGRKDNGSRIRERRFGKFVRRFSLGPHISGKGIEAAYKNGVLTVKLPKTEEAKPRQIPVTVH